MTGFSTFTGFSARALRALAILAAVVAFPGLAVPPAGAEPPRPHTSEPSWPMSLLRCGVTAGDQGQLVAEPFRRNPTLSLQNSISARLNSGRTVHLNMIVILADFSDRPARREEHDTAHYESLFFSRGTHPTGSMADFYFENSGGRVLLDGEVHGWYLMPERYETYVSRQAGLGIYPFNSQGLVEDAVRAADRQVNYARFDSEGADEVPDTIDDDTMIDLLLVIHAGPGGESAGSATNLQSIAFALPNPTPFDGVFANEFALAPEEANLGVYAHETGHLFGLPDLYDLTGSSFGLGTWSLMAGGWSLDEARTPAHLDPWCKAQLGFVTPINVAGTLDDVVFDPVETGGEVYRLAPGGTLEREYFLVENRRRVGFDRFLPGEGLLIYHVNETRPTNNLPLNYRVALEQADGLFQLENMENGPSFGDAGDPWTEDSPSRGFGRFTTPDSRLQNGQETGVTVYHIRGPDAAGRTVADLRVTIGPSIQVESLSLDPVEGDGDAFAEAGETIAIRPELIVRTAVAHDVVLRVRSVNPLVEIIDGEIVLGDLPVGTHSPAKGFGVRIAGNLPANPYGADFTLDIDFRDEVPLSRGLTVALGDVTGLTEDFESTAARWSHHPGRIGFYDLWRLEPSGGRPRPDDPASAAWHCGNPTMGYRGGTDAILETPLFILPPSAHLLLDHLLETPAGDSGGVIAGGFVEISLNGGEWTEVTPTRGYDRIYFGADDYMNGRWILTEDKPGAPTWETLDFDLSRFSGGARLRFRFFSAATVFVGAGWWLDNLRITSGGTPVTLGRFEARRGIGGAELNWTLTGAEAVTGLLVYRGDPAGEIRLTPVPLAPAPTGSFIDLSPPPDAARYRLEAVERDGGVRSLGQIWLEAGDPTVPGVPAASIRCAPNPMAGVTQFSLSLARPGAARLRVFDARGRLVQTLLDEELPEGVHAILWDGRDAAGRSVPAGIYLYRLDAAGQSLSRKVVVSR